jgi:predicted MFS family arabinose efflux permease
VYSVFMDVAMAVTGPLGGWIASGMGYNAIYGFAAVAAMLSIVLTLVLHAQAARDMPSLVAARADS